MRFLGNPNIGALIIRIGFWRALHYNYNKEPPRIVQVITTAGIEASARVEGRGLRLEAPVSSHETQEAYS